ncbi:hypothetical protein Tco_0092341 [Tanacetum coccineum]
MLLPRPGFVDGQRFLSDPGRLFLLVDLPSIHLNGPRKLLTARKRVGPLPARRLAWRRASPHSSDHHPSSSSSSLDSSPVHSSGLDAPDQAHSGSSTRDVPPRLCYPLRRAPRRSEAFRHWCAAPLSTLYPPTTSESSSGDSSERPLHSSSHSAGPSHKRCRYPDAIVIIQDMPIDLRRIFVRDFYHHMSSFLEVRTSKVRAMLYQRIGEQPSSSHVSFHREFLSRTMINTRSGMTFAAIEEMINQRMDAALEARRVNRDLELGNE